MTPCGSPRSCTRAWGSSRHCVSTAAYRWFPCTTTALTMGEPQCSAHLAVHEVDLAVLAQPLEVEANTVAVHANSRGNLVDERHVAVFLFKLHHECQDALASKVALGGMCTGWHRHVSLRS